MDAPPPPPGWDAAVAVELAAQAPHIAALANLISTEPATLQCDEMKPLREALIAAGATLPAAKATPATSPGAEVARGLDLGDGCYLYIEELQKRMMIQYSRTTIAEKENAILLAFCRPGKPFGGFKYTSKGGISEHVTEALQHGPEKFVKGYFRGWAMFMKLVKACDGELVIINGTDVGLYTNSKLAVKKLDPASSHRFDGVDAVACMPPNSLTYKVKEMDLEMFTNKGNQEGYSLSFGH